MTTQTTTTLAVFQLDQTFGSLRLVPERDHHRLVGIDLWPTTVEALERLHRSGGQAVLLVPDVLTPDSLQTLSQLLPTIVEIIPLRQNLGKALIDRLQSLPVDADQTLFVAADRVLRGIAASKGLLAASHPAIASLLLRGCSLRFARLIGDRERFDRLTEVVPYSWQRADDGSWSLLGVLSSGTLVEAARRQLRVEALPLDLATEDPLLLRLDSADSAEEGVAKAVRGYKVLFAEDHRMLLALSPSDVTDGLNIRGAHGYLEALIPCPELMQPAVDASVALRKSRLTLRHWPQEMIQVTTPARHPELSPVILQLCPSTMSSFQTDISRFSGLCNLDSSGPITSRHILHADNARAVQALLSELSTIGYVAYTQSFSFAGMTLHNIIADLPGTGYLRLDPTILERLRHLIVKHPLPLPDPPDPVIQYVRELVGDAWLKEQGLHKVTPSALRATIERMFELKPWFPWWLKSCPLPGLGAQIVLVGCHLDSSASFTVGYDAYLDPAPGADDNASGIAATLAIARYLSNFRDQLIHTVRFCFFNAEEAGIIGSKVYAAMLKAAGAPIKAVICTDMIGYNSDAARIFELHAGYTDPAIRDTSVPIANAIALWAASLGMLAPAQLYKGTIGMSGADRDLYDGAIGRSDHAAFHQQGYPAVVISEDFFVNRATEPGADPNPNYHTRNDTVTDSAYGNDITCAMAYAVKELAES